MENIAYYNGKIASIEEMMIPMNERSSYFGDGVYDAMFTVQHVPLALDALQAGHQIDGGIVDGYDNGNGRCVHSDPPYAALPPLYHLPGQNPRGRRRLFCIARRRAAFARGMDAVCTHHPFAAGFDRKNGG